MFCRTVNDNDNYMTPKSAWVNIQHFIPRDKTIWEPFFGDGSSGNHLVELGFDVIHNDEDFFKNNRGDIIVSNPPFSKKKEVFTRLKELNKPFIIICSSSMITYKYWRELFKDIDFKIIIPSKRIQFLKYDPIKKESINLNRCSFDCFYYCYKIDLPKQINYL